MPRFVWRARLLAADRTLNISVLGAQLKLACKRPTTASIMIHHYLLSGRFFMAEKDKVIKSGQITLPRLLFLVAVGGLIVLMVYSGGLWLTIGYWVLTLAICAVLFLSAIDYGVQMEKVDLAAAEASPVGTPSRPITTPSEIKAATGEARPKRRSSRPTKRRR
jgi:hypothetical protein